MLTENTTPLELFDGIFPFCYMAAMREGSGVFEEHVPALEINEDIAKGYVELMLKYMDLNSKGANIFFTPNGVKTTEERHREDNFQQFNSWYIDIDIDDTKNPGHDALRERKKEDLRGQILMLEPEIWPSMTIETRNGFQLYWFCVGSSIPKEDWLNIERGILEYFLPYGADRSSIKILQLLRVPCFKFWKKGETGMINIVYPLSTGKTFTVTAMKEHFWKELPKDIKPKDIKFKKTPEKVTNANDDDIFEKVHALPIRHVVSTMSGHWLVHNETITFERHSSIKSNLLFNSKPSPVWIDERQNAVFSNNADRPGPTITQFLLWYQWTKGDIARGLKELFT